MALQATFSGNWKQWDEGLENAKKNIVAFEMPVKNMQRQLQQMTSSFDGTRMVREMSLASAAIEKIGGVAKLTESEQRKWNATAQETIEKYRAMGASVPADIQKVSDELKQAVKAADDLAEKNKKTGESMVSLSGIAKSVGGVLAGAFTVQALIGFGKELVDLGGKITDLSERTGISTDGIQELTYAAEQTGSSIESIVGSIEKMSIKLVEQSTETKRAVGDLGLSLSELQQMRPEDAFTAIADAVGAMQDPMRQVEVGAELMGKGFAQNLPAMKAGIKDLREEARELGQVLSKDTVKSLDEFGDKWTTVMTSLKVAAAEAVLDITKTFESLPNVIDAALAAGRLGMGPGGVGAAVALTGNAARIRDGREHKSDIALPPEVIKAATDYAEQLKNVRAELAGLSEATKRQIIAGDALGRSEEEIGKKIADQLKNRELATDVVKVYLDALKEMESQQKKLAGMSMVADFQETIAKARQLAKEVDSGQISIKNLGEKQGEVNKLLREAEQAMKAVGATGDPLYRRISDLANATSDWSAMLPKVKSGLDDILKTASVAAATKVPSGTLLDIMFGDAGKLGSVKLGDLPNAGFKVDNADKQWEDFFGKAKIEAMGFGKSLDDVSRSLSQLGQIKPLEGALADFAELINLMNIGAQMGEGLANAFRSPRMGPDGKPMKDPAGNVLYNNFSWDNFKGANGTQAQVGAYMQIAQTALAVSSGSTPVLRATDTMGRGNRALRGAAAGAAEGAAFGPYGAAGGAIFGALIGAFRNPALEDVYKRVAHGFGVELQEETARAIGELAKNKFNKNRDAAEIFSLDTIISEGGGLKDTNAKALEARFRDTFSMIETGNFTMQQGREVLDKNFATFAQHVRDTEGIASKTFQEIIALNQTFHTNSKAIKQFVEEQTGVLGNSVATLAAPLVEKNESFKERITNAQKAVADAQRGGDSQEQEQASGRLNDILVQQREFAAGSADELERLGVIALGSFNAAVSAGSDWLTAVEGMGPALDTLMGLQRDLGLESQNAGLLEVQRFRDLVTNNQSLVLSTQALGETMKALSSIGGLTTETLAAMEAQGGTTFDRLIAAGFTENQALTQMKGFLLNVIHAHEQLGTPIDENTQRLIKLAQEQGLLKDDGKDMANILTKGFADMKVGTDKLVGSIGLMVKALGKDVPESVQDAIDALDKIPREIDINARVIYDDPGAPGGPSNGDSGSGPEHGAAHGIYATGPTATWFGEGGQPELGGPVDFMGDVLARAMNRAGRGGRTGGGTTEIHVHLEANGREFAHAVVPYIPGVLDFHGATR